MTRSVETLVRDHIGAVFSAQEPVTMEELHPQVGGEELATEPVRKGIRASLPLALAVSIAIVAFGLLPQLVLTDDEPRGGLADPSDVNGQIALPGLPLEGATPSFPKTGELIASMWEHVGAPGSFGNGWIYLYGDGRLVWAQADPSPTGGWIEQRLTPAGVDLIRSEIVRMLRSELNSGVFDLDRPLPTPNYGFPRDVNGGSIQVRSGDRLVYVNQVVPELFDRIADLWSWVPRDAWVQPEAIAYVPSRYAVCIHNGGIVEPMKATEHLSDLPPAAQELLAEARVVRMSDLADVDPAGFATAAGSTGDCFDITTQRARALVAALDEAGLKELPQRPYDGGEIFYVISSGLDQSPGAGFDGVTLAIWPMLPHGVPALIGA